jgi:hypothetical protein
MPCTHGRRLGWSERQALMVQLAKRVEPSRIAVRRRQAAEGIERQRQLVASGAERGFVVGDPASWRRWARQDLADRAPWVLDERKPPRR